MSSKSPSKSGTGGNPVTYREVDDNHAGQRLDNFLVARLKGVPKSRIYRIIRKGEVRVNRKRVRPEYKLECGDVVRIPPVRLAEPRAQTPPSVALSSLLKDSILFSDADILILNKPAGLPVHGGTGVKTGLIEALRHTFPDADGLELVHRLDKGTSGCLLLAKNGKALKDLAAQFKTGKVSKTYHALVEGAWPEDVSEVGAALKRQQPRGGERKVVVDREGKTALTRFRILTRFPAATLVQANPVTGRTHQIRVHARLAGHPVIGDEKYADAGARKQFAAAGIRRLCLHAAELRLNHPVTGAQVSVSAPGDEQFLQAIRILGTVGTL